MWQGKYTFVCGYTLIYAADLKGFDTEIATMVFQCRFCLGFTNSMKYRDVRSVLHLKEGLEELLEVKMGFNDVIEFVVCPPCLDKLYKIAKVNQELTKKVESHKRAKDLLVTAIKNNDPKRIRNNDTKHDSHNTLEKPPVENRKRRLVENAPARTKILVKKDLFVEEDIPSALQERLSCNFKQVRSQELEDGEVDMKKDGPEIFKVL